MPLPVILAVLDDICFRYRHDPQPRKEKGAIPDHLESTGHQTMTRKEIDEGLSRSRL
jgi:hypothetical protein